jgi:hypothetical protein
MTYQVKNRFSKFAFQTQPAALHNGLKPCERPAQGRSGSVDAVVRAMTAVGLYKVESSLSIA